MRNDVGEEEEVERKVWVKYLRIGDEEDGGEFEVLH